MAITLNGSAGVTTNSGAVYDGLQSGTAVSASGTSVDFTGIPSWVKRITVILNGVSTTGTSNLQVQLGTSGGVVNTGYTSYASKGVTVVNSSSGMLVLASALAASSYNGSATLLNISGNSWVSQSVVAHNTTAETVSVSGGNVSLSNVLDRVRITTVNGTDTFDAGTINIIYE